MILLLLLSFSPWSLAEDQLLLSQAVFRHGARGPVWSFSSDESKNHFYRGLGELTNEGVQQAYDLGKALRVRLVDNGFLDKRYLPSEVSFLSSFKSRCMITASVIGSALFDQVKPGVPNSVNVQTAPPNDDYLCVPQTSLKQLDEMYQVAGGNRYDNRTINDLMDFVLSGWARNSTHFQSKERLLHFESLLIEKPLGLVVPNWFNDEAEKEASSFRFKGMSFVTGTAAFENKKWIKCRTGYLLFTILNNINLKLNCGDRCMIRKFYAYSTHDFMVMSLLSSLAILDEALHSNVPPFTATILIELWKSEKGKPYVKILWRNPGESFIPLTSHVRGCLGEDNCPAANFTSCCKEFVTDDPKAECGSSSSTFSTYSVLALLAIVFWR